MPGEFFTLPELARLAKTTRARVKTTLVAGGVQLRQARQGKSGRGTAIIVALVDIKAAWPALYERIKNGTSVD